MLVLVVTAAVSLGLGALGLPSPVLFGALVGGMAHALTSPTELRVPPAAFRVGQGVIGVTIGAMVSVAALQQAGRDLLPIALVTLGTLALSLGAGRLLALRRDVSPVTGAFALIAGGASGIVAVARDLGADERVVTVVQYLRVLVVLLAMPLVTSVVFAPAGGAGGPGDAGVTGAAGSDGALAAETGFVLVSLVLGLALARALPVPTGVLLWPMLVAAVLAATGWLGAAGVPVLVQWVGYLLIGVQVGLRFTRESLRSIARMLPVVLVLIAGLVVSTAAMGAVLARATEVDGLTAYLATTPGGLFAVLATAADSGADVTYVLAVQVLRLVVILLLTPLLARWLRPDAGPSSR
ncbi:AbrB family transcriptional regulator [Nocardioides sp. Leaf374]|uniref:AbrB family transcriptional regulator n=1 Tax=Nocardioides sp. Leaf374 TaxID=2876560 RepID=UPI001E37652B|nr:AbrB family transcriptional regulator [Nocardioides sp. Leaf374]